MSPEVQSHGVKPWDVSDPGFTHYTKRADTFILYLQEPDSKEYEIAYADGKQMGVRLFGPNGNVIVWKAQREYDHSQNTHATVKRVGTDVVRNLMNFPKAMNYNHRQCLAAQVALFLGLEKVSRVV